MNVPTITNRIDSLLKEKGISKQSFYDDCNLSSSAYSQWNTGKTSPRIGKLREIASYLGTTYEYLITGLGEREKAPIDEEASARIALFGGDTEVTDEMWDEAQLAAEIIKERHKRKNGEAGGKG